MPTLVIPNTPSPAGWTPGVHVGVIGGIEQYLPGGANQRTTLRNVVTEFGADNTGTNDVASVLQPLIYSTITTNNVLYFPYGLYRFAAGLYLLYWQMTVRGAGEGVLSTSSVTIPTSLPATKVFTVPSGLGWTAGIGTRIWHVQQRWKWMQGTVVSYSGTTLTVSVTSTSGHTDTMNLWTVGQTVMLSEAGGIFSSQGGDGNTGPAMIIGSPTAGSTTLTIDTTGSPYIGSGVCKIDLLTEINGEVYHHDPGVRGSYSQRNYITSVVGSTVTLARPLIMDLPVARLPRIFGSSLSQEKVGHEYYAAFGAGTTPVRNMLVSLQALHNSWIYHCQLWGSDAYMVQLGDTVGCEIAYSYIGGDYGDVLPGTAPLSMGGVDYFLLRHSITHHGLTTEGVPDYNNVHLYNLATGFRWTANHGSGSRYRLYEGNIVNGIQWDGYHGSCKLDTAFRNWCYGGGDYSAGYAFLFWARYTRQANSVGNIVGKVGENQHALSYGYPSGGQTDGVTVYPALWVSSGGTAGSRFLHWDTSGHSRVTGVIASHSGTQVTITLDSPYTVENSLVDPWNNDSTPCPINIIWGPPNSDSTQIRGYCSLVYAGSSGSTIIVDGATGTAGCRGIGSSGPAFPADGTAVAIAFTEYGGQELDGSAAATSFTKKNYLYGPLGAPGSIDFDTTDTLPNSLAYSSQPTDWPSSLAWPPAINVANPNAVNYSVIPAGVYYNTGEWPAATIVGTAPTISITFPTAPPTIIPGSAQTFTATASDVEDGSLTSSIVWTSSISGALGTGATINPVLSAGIHNITATVTDSDSNTRSASIVATVVAAPANLTLPTVSGTGVVGSPLTFTTGTWSGSPTPTLASILRRCDNIGLGCFNITGSDNVLTYTPVLGDVGQTFRIRVTGTNSGGSASADSAASAMITSGVVSGSPVVVFGMPVS